MNNAKLQGKTITASIYGHDAKCLVLVVNTFSLDVQRLSDGKCFRISDAKVRP